MKNCHSSQIEISRSHYLRNIQFIRKRIRKDVKISAVVKSNAYGHGIKQIVPLGEEAGIDHFSVFSVFEAKRVREVVSNRSDIMVMGWVSDSDLPWILKNGVEIFVFDMSFFRKAITAARKLNIKLKFHLEVETGMNRTGIDSGDLNEVIGMIADNLNYLEFIGICTHLAGAESIANHVRINRQLKKFGKIIQLFGQNELNPVFRHVSSSAGVINYPRAHFDLVRVGIMQYGYWPNIETRIHYQNNRKTHKDPLKRILTWKSQIMTVKEVSSGEYISYGNSYIAQEEKTIAVIPVGYSAGYPRNLSNYGMVLIHGQLVKVIGLVNMNMIIVDVSLLTAPKRGDEVVIIGEQGEMEISVSSFSEMTNMLNYESLSLISSNIKRNVI